MNRAERRRREKEARKRAKRSGADPTADVLSPAAEQALAAAAQHHGAGRLTEAEAGYRQVLAENPNHPVVLHLAGVAAYQLGNGDDAVGLMERAVGVKPDFFEALNNLGAAYRALDRTDDAIASYRRAIAVKPDYAEAHFNLGNALHQQGELAEARQSFLRALEIAPTYAEAHNNLGNVVKALGRLDEAVSSFRDAVAHRPDFAEAHNNLGTALLALNEPAAAARSLRDALALSPELIEAHNNLGNALAELGQTDAALARYAEALKLDPDHAEAHYNMANVLMDAGRAEDALAAFDRAIACRAEYVDAHINRANALQALRRLTDAEAAYERAIELDADSAEARTNLGLLQLMGGNFEDGWSNYGARFRRRDVALRRRAYAPPHWAGEPLQGRTVFVYPEQGFGDTIQFARYLPMLAAQGANVAFEAPAPLHRLFETGGFTGTLLCEGETPGAFDFHASLLELPGLFATTIDIIPPPADLLAPPPELANAWAERIGKDDGFRVGLAWAGRPTHANDRNRSLPAAMLVTLAGMAGVRLYSLQVGRDGEAGDAFGDDIIDLAPELEDFADTAAAMQALDLVITVDTSLAHLAGALGRPVWTLLPFIPDWRWQLDRDDSLWYPSMRLFRQQRLGDWPGAVGAVAGALRDAAGARG